MTTALLLRSATLPGGSTCAGLRLTAQVTADVRIVDDRVTAIDPPGTLFPGPDEVILDLAGYMLLPAPAEPHTHLDRALLADRLPNPSGDLDQAIEMMGLAAPSLTSADVLSRARQAAQIYLAAGATAIRSHVDVGGAVGLRNLEALLRLREELRGSLTLQLVAHVIGPTSAAAGAAGARNATALREALALGADVAGGAPSLDPDPTAAMQVCLDAAAAAGVPVDLHTDEHLHADEPWDADSAGLAALAHLVLDRGFPHRVTASHCAGLGVQPVEWSSALAEVVARAGVCVVALPQTSLYRLGRRPSIAPIDGVTAVRALLDAGVPVAAGGDHLRDPFHPMGRGDPLETASLLVTAAHLAATQAYTAISADARVAMGLPEVPAGGVLHPGVPADLLAVRATSMADAIAAAQADRTVISGGQIVARTRVTRSFAMHPTVRSSWQPTVMFTTPWPG